jgi:RNA polymerase sigma-70 factor (ECF subfamily)
VSPLLLRRLSDEQLGSRLASGEAAAFDELYRRYVHRLSAYGANLLGDSASGDDVAQSALLKAYGALREGRVPERVKPWLFRIAHNSAIDLVVRRRELPSAELPEGSTGSGEPVERSGALVAALASLPERQRRVYVLRELHGLRIDETAAELGLSSSQVEQSLFVARNRLAEHLVFGDRLNCVAVQRLVAGPLDRDERRALKTHLRSCPSCRGAVGLRGRALGLLPVASFDWLRGLFAGLATGGAPAAAKVGAVVATATFAAGVPVAADEASHHPRPLVPHVVSQVAAPSDRAEPIPRSAAITRVAVPAVTVVRATPGRSRPVIDSETHRDRRPGKDGRDSSPATAPSPVILVSDGGRDGGGGSGSAGSDGGPAQTTTTNAPAPVAVPVAPVPSGTVTTTSSDGGGGGGEGGGDSAPATAPVTTQPTSSDDTHGGDGNDSGSSSGSGDGSSHD